MSDQYLSQIIATMQPPKAGERLYLQCRYVHLSGDKKMITLVGLAKGGWDVDWFRADDEGNPTGRRLAYSDAGPAPLRFSDIHTLVTLPGGSDHGTAAIAGSALEPQANPAPTSGRFRDDLGIDQGGTCPTCGAQRLIGQSPHIVHP